MLNCLYNVLEWYISQQIRYMLRGLVEVAVGCSGLGGEDGEGGVWHYEELSLRAAELT
jgi:hypothetical protein